MALKTPNALGRSGDPWKVTVSRPSAEGASMAPNAPCSVLAATSIPNDCDRPPMAEATANPVKPPISVHLRPNRSPSLPPSSRRLPNASAYAVMIHWRLLVEKCSAFCADGSAMFTIVASSTTISCATPSSASTAQRLGAGRLTDAVGPVLMSVLEVSGGLEGTTRTHLIMDDPCNRN